MQENLYHDPIPAAGKPSRLTRLSAITGAGLLAALIAAGLGGAASAQTIIDEGAAPAQIIEEPAGRVLARAVQLEGEPPEEVFEESPEDDAIWQQFDQCMADAGLSEDDFDETHESGLDEATIDAAFEQCDPILDELSDEVILGEFGGFDELSEADVAVFDQYDECLTAGGIDALFEAEGADGFMSDESAIDALFEQCDPILESLSDDAQALFEDCPEDEGHEGLEDED